MSPDMAREKLRIIHVILVGLLLSTGVYAGEWTPLRVVATAYCPCSICCGVRAAGLTADGSDVSVRPYGVASDPRRLPYGTLVHVPIGCGYLDHQQPADRTFVVDDTGGIVRRLTRSTKTVHIDLRYVRHSSAVKYGRQEITIYVWKP